MTGVASLLIHRPDSIKISFALFELLKHPEDIQSCVCLRSSMP